MVNILTLAPGATVRDIELWYLLVSLASDVSISPEYVGKTLSRPTGTPRAWN
jgi:hypothetical protein